MQLIHPGQWPFLDGIFMFFLFLFGVLSFISFVHGSDLINKSKSNSKAFSFRVIGTFGLCFVLYNFMNYNYIHSKSANQIVGTFYSIKNKNTLKIHKNQTWEMHGETFTAVHGTWKHHISEDVSPYWDLDSKDSGIFEQVYNYDTIKFESKNLIFIRKF